MVVLSMVLVSNQTQWNIQKCALSFYLKNIHELIPSPPSMRFGGNLTTLAHCSENMTVDA